MTTPQHTPGPRKIHDLNTSTPHVGTISNAKAIFGRTLAIIDNYKTNATPIAAAPDLLEALELAADELQLISDEQDGRFGKTVDKLLAAITKARGENL